MPIRAKTLSQIKKQTATPKPDNRPSAAARGYGSRWVKLRAMFVKTHQLCVRCLEEGYTVGYEVVDHIIPHKGNNALLYDYDNLQSLCKRHHDIKTATEDGGFGRAVKIKETNHG